MDEEEFRELAAGHALGALSAEDERAYTDGLASHPEWAHFAVEDASAVAALADAGPDVAPPSHIRDELLARIESLPPEEEPPGGSSPRRRRSWGGRAWFALAASIALVTALAAGTTIAVQSLTRSPAATALEQIEAAPDAESQSTPVSGGGTATLHWSVDLGTAVLVTEGLPALESTDAFEMWLIRGERAQPAGVFEAGTATTALVEGKMRPGDLVAVTIEPAGGSPTGQPTTDPLFAIATG